jgi:hypothetical protein
MTNMNPVDVARALDHAAAMNARWLFLASLVVFGVFAVVVRRSPSRRWCRWTSRRERLPVRKSRRLRQWPAKLVDRRKRTVRPGRAVGLASLGAIGRLALGGGAGTLGEKDVAMFVRHL